MIEIRAEKSILSPGLFHKNTPERLDVQRKTIQPHREKNSPKTILKLWKIFENRFGT